MQILLILHLMQKLDDFDQKAAMIFAVAAQDWPAAAMCSTKAGSTKANEGFRFPLVFGDRRDPPAIAQQGAAGLVNLQPTEPYLRREFHRYAAGGFLRQPLGAGSQAVRPPRFGRPASGNLDFHLQHQEGDECGEPLSCPAVLENLDGLDIGPMQAERSIRIDMPVRTNRREPRIGRGCILLYNQGAARVCDHDVKGYLTAIISWDDDAQAEFARVGEADGVAIRFGCPAQPAQTWTVEKPSQPRGRGCCGVRR